MCVCVHVQLFNLYKAVDGGEEEREHGPGAAGQTEGTTDRREQERTATPRPDPALRDHFAGTAPLPKTLSGSTCPCFWDLTGPNSPVEYGQV